jgi:hypothetical protein
VAHRGALAAVIALVAREGLDVGDGQERRALLFELTAGPRMERHHARQWQRAPFTVKHFLALVLGHCVKHARPVLQRLEITDKSTPRVHATTPTATHVYHSDIPRRGMSHGGRALVRGVESVPRQ